MEPDLHIVKGQEPKKLYTPKPLSPIPLHDLYNRPRPKITYLIDKLIAAGSTFIVSGTRGVWKSWTLTSMLVSVAAQIPFMDKFAVTTTIPDSGSVLFFQLEERPWQAQRKVQWLLAGAGLDRDPRAIQDMLAEYVVGQSFAIEAAGRLDEIKRIVDDIKPDLVLWDSLRRMTLLDCNKDENAAALVSMIAQLQEVHPSAHGIVAHWRKRQGEKDLNEAGERVRGSSAILDQVDGHLAIERDKVNDVATMLQDKNRDGEEMPAFSFRVRILDSEGRATLSYLGSSANMLEAEGCKRAVYEKLKEDRYVVWKRPDLRREMAKQSFTDQQTDYAIECLERAGHVLVDKKRKGGSPNLIRLREALPDPDARPDNRTGPDN